MLINSKEYSRRSQSFLIPSKNSTYLMEPEDSSPYSQQHGMCSYPTPDQSSLLPHSMSRISVLILFCHFRRFQSRILPSGLPTKIPVLNSPLSHTFYMPPHPFFFDAITEIVFGEEHRSWSLLLLLLLLYKFICKFYLVPLLSNI
jgi:hypothetical protein